MSARESSLDVRSDPAPAVPSSEVATVLVVDDSPLDRHLVGRLLESMKDVRVVCAHDGREGLEAIARESPSVILTDLVMPDREGLELVKRVRAEHPQIAVILMTAYGSEEVAVRALRAGAACYIPKKDMARELPATLRRVLNLASMRRDRGRILGCLVRRESVFLLDSDPNLIMALMTLIQEELEGMTLCDPTGRIFGMMPHPERFLDIWQHPRWTRREDAHAIEGDGLRIFRSAVLALGG